MSEPRMIIRLQAITGNTRISRDVDVAAESPNQPDSMVFRLGASQLVEQITGMLRGIEPPTTTDATEGRTR